MDKITVTPQDDPSAANAEIEIIATATEANGKLKRFLVRVRIPATITFKKAHEGSQYAEKCVRIGFEKQGYKVWDRGRIDTVIHDDKGDYYIWGLFEQK